MKTASNKARELEAYDKRVVDFSKFKPDLSSKELQEVFKSLGNIVIFPPPFFFRIETLSVTKTVGRGRTNLTIIAPTIVQADAATPSASFDPQATPTRKPAIQMHFEPSAYGITSTASYLMIFTIAVSGQSTFDLSGFAGAGTVLNGGTKVLAGQTSVTLVLQNVPASQQTFGVLQQTGVGAWSWFSVEVRFPPLVATM